MNFVEIEFDGIEKDENLIKLAQKVYKVCFEHENILNKNLYINLILTTPSKIRELNKSYRDIDKETDVLSFPMFERGEVEGFSAKPWQEALGDVVVSIDRVKEQAVEYGHSFEREFCYMLVHGFCHLMGEDHIIEEEKAHMRKKEEEILSILGITREN